MLKRRDLRARAPERRLRGSAAPAVQSHPRSFELDARGGYWPPRRPRPSLPTLAWRSRREGGTSMATPLVAGCAAIVRQYLRTQAHPISKPSAALVKALLINAAHDL